MTWYRRIDTYELGTWSFCVAFVYDRGFGGAFTVDFCRWSMQIGTEKP